MDFSPHIGRERAGLRPALVISHERFNRIENGLHIVVPITGMDRGLAYHVRVEPPEGGLTKPSVIMCDQAKSQSSERFRKYLGSVEDRTLRTVQSIVATLIDQ